VQIQENDAGFASAAFALFNQLQFSISGELDIGSYGNPGTSWF
jgi:hypothetical protein